MYQCPGFESSIHIKSIYFYSKADDNITEMETLVVVTKEEIPYVMLKEGKTGNAAYDGFAIDLLKVNFC